MRFSLFAVAAATAVIASPHDYEVPQDVPEVEAPQDYPVEEAPAPPVEDSYEDVPPQETDCADEPEITEVHTSTHTNYITVTQCAPGYADCPLLPETSSELPVEETYAPEPEPIPSYEPEPIPEPIPSYEPEPMPEPETSSFVVPAPEETPYYPASNTTSWVGPTGQTSLVPIPSEPLPPVEQPEPTGEPTPPSEEPPAQESEPAEAGAAGVVVRGGLMAGLVAVSMMVLC